jgi:cysteine desulfurase/selenocysteine lyase
MDVLNSMPPYQGGGDMIEKVSFAGTTYKEPPYRFEAGTPPIAQVIGLGAAIAYVTKLGMKNILAHEYSLLSYATGLLSAIDGVQIIGQAKDKAAIISFLIDGTHPFDVAAVLDRQGVATRVGHHCAEPLMDRLGIVGTVRASFGLYNNKADADRLVSAIARSKELLL